MRPVEFPGANAVYGKDQPEYNPLPSMRSSDGSQVCSCWGLNLRERLRVLFTGRVYLTLLTFGQPLQPQLMTVEPPELESAP